jgi:hypothetical protein
MSRRPRASVALFAAIGLLGASNAVQAAHANQGAAGGSEACTLITKDDAAAALGEAAIGPKSASGRSAAGSGTTASSCEYEGSGIHRVRLNLMHFTPDMAAIYRGMCAQKSQEGLSGLGDIACWYNDKHEELQVLKGTTFVSIELRRSGNPTEGIKDAAKKALARVK